MSFAKSLVIGTLLGLGLCGSACSMEKEAPPAPPSVAAPAKPTEPGAQPAQQKRQIAEEVSLRLRTPKPRQVAEQLTMYVESQGGYLVSSRSGSDGTSDTDAHFSFRIPVANLNASLAHLRQLGEPLSETRKGEDLTTEVVDTDARLSSKRTLEKRLLELLSAARNVDETLKVETELARVRTEIEQLVGHARGLGQRTAFALVDVALVSPEPAQFVATKSFGARLVGAFRSALSTSESVILGLIELAGGLVPLALLGIAIWLPLRHWYRRHRASVRARMQQAYGQVGSPAWQGPPVSQGDKSSDPNGVVRSDE